MSKKSIRPNKQQKRLIKESKEKARKNISKKTYQARLKTFFWALSLIFGLIGGIASVSSLFPRISVIPTAAVDQSNASSAPFILTNNSVIPIYISEIKLLIGDVASFGGVHKGFENIFPKSYPRREVGFVSPKWKNINLTMDSSITFSIEDFANNLVVPTNMANIAIQVSFRSWFFPILRAKIFPFKTRLQSNGLLDWYTYPWEEAEEWAKKNPLPPKKPN